MVADGCEAALAKGTGFAGSDEADTAAELLGALASQSDEALAACVGRPVFGFLDNQVSLLARKLTLRTCAVPHSRLVGTSGAPADGGAAALAPPVAVSLSGISLGGGGEATGDFGEIAPEGAPRRTTLPARAWRALPRLALIGLDSTHARALLRGTPRAHAPPPPPNIVHDVLHVLRPDGLLW